MKFFLKRACWAVISSFISVCIGAAVTWIVSLILTVEPLSFKFWLCTWGFCTLLIITAASLRGEMTEHKVDAKDEDEEE